MHRYLGSFQPSLLFRLNDYRVRTTIFKRCCSLSHRFQRALEPHFVIFLVSNEHVLTLIRDRPFLLNSFVAILFFFFFFFFESTAFENCDAKIRPTSGSILNVASRVSRWTKRWGLIIIIGTIYMKRYINSSICLPSCQCSNCFFRIIFPFL